MLINQQTILISFRTLLLTILFIMAQGVYAVDVLVNMTDSPDPATRGGKITYTIVTQDQSNDIAPNVSLSFPLPATTTYVSDDSTQCNHDGGTPGIVNCAFGNLQGTATGPGDVKTVKVIVKTTSATPTVISNIVATSSTTGDTNSGNNSNTPQNTTIDDGADLTTTLLALPDPSVIAAGDVNYTAVLTNNGPNTAQNISVVFQLSINMTYVTNSASGTGWSCSYNSGNRQLTCTGSGLSNGDSANTITFKGKVTGAQTGNLATTAAVSTSTSDPEPNNDVVINNVNVAEGTDVSVTISANSLAVIENQTTIVTLKPRNLGSFDAANVVVNYTAPPGFTYQTLPTGDGWACVIDGGDAQTYHCSRGTYIVGATKNITFTLNAPAYSAGNKLNTATISTTTAEAVERLTNNSASLNMTLEHNGVDLRISKIKTPTPVAQGTNMVSTIKVTNDGPLNASSGTITITDLLDIGNITYVSGTGTNWTCDDFATTTPNVVCTYNAVLNNGNTTPALMITTTATGIGSISNTATVSYSGVPGDYDSSNNSTGAVGVTSTNSGTNSADLVVTKAVNADNSDGDTTTLAIDENSMTYTINIQNNGPSNVTGITMTDAIPNYVNNSSGETGIAFNAPGYSCNSSGKNVTCTQSGTLSNTDTDTIEIIVTRPLLDGTNVRNTASAFSSAQGDLNRTNNSNFIDVNIAPVADLLIQSKVVTPTDVKSGTEATYLITIKNNGPSTAQNVAVTDIFDLPVGDAGFTFISAIAPIGGSCSGLTGGQSYVKTDTPTLTCNWASIPSGSTRTISMIIRPNFLTGSPDGRIFKNTVSGTTTTHESDLTNNSIGPILLTVNKDLIDLVINNNDQSAGLGPDPLGHDPANGGDNANNDVIFDLDYVNRGPSFATGVNIKYFITPKDGKTVKFMCDEAASADACNTSADKCTVSNGSNPITGNAAGTATLTLSCSMPDMVADSSLHFHRYLTFRVISIPDGLGDTHDTNALISANENETILLNNAEPDDVTVRAKVDLQLTKVPSKANVKVTEPFDWIITVTNNGPASSFQADLSDSLPANMNFYGATPTWVNATDTTNGNCSVSGKDLACDFGTNGAISNGASVVVTVPVMVTHFINPTEQNCASATTNNSGVDPSPNNNTNICGTVAVTNLFFPSDFGDAPDTGIGTATVNYQTQLTDSGPRHLLDLVNPGQIYLGGCVDSDNGTLQNTNADQDDITANAGETIGSCTSGDDEDGVVVPTLIANQTATLQIEIGGNICQLDGWIDYNADGDFTDTDEQIFSNKTLNPGSNSENIVVPANLAFGNSYARFRCSDVGGLAPTGHITGGEVEDYLVSLQPDSSITATAVDYGDAPDTGIGTLTGNYQTLPNDNGASHILGIANAPYLGSCVDSDANTAQNFSATADDFGPAAGVTPTVTTGTCSGADDEDGVILNSELKQAIPASISVIASAGTNSCILNAWIDYNQDGVFNNSNEKIANNQTIASGATAILTPTIPANSLAGITYARFRCASSGGLNSTGAAVDGEVEDYQVSIIPNLTLASTKVDFGDAPDGTTGELKSDYSTTEFNNGPSHVIGLPNSPYLGLCVDSDDGTAQNMTADGDNVVGSTTVGTCDVDGQDEDGVSLVGGLTLGGQTNIKIVTAADGACVLNGWIDFNQDGQFSGSEEQVITNKSQSAGTTKTYQVNVPTSAKVGQTYSRFRCSTASGLGPVGPAPDGEVEDYAVTVHSATGIPTVSEWGLMILMLLISWFAYTQRFSVRPSP